MARYSHMFGMTDCSGSPAYFTGSNETIDRVKIHHVSGEMSLVARLVWGSVVLLLQYWNWTGYRE